MVIYLMCEPSQAPEVVVSARVQSRYFFIHVVEAGPVACTGRRFCMHTYHTTYLSAHGSMVYYVFGRRSSAASFTSTAVDNYRKSCVMVEPRYHQSVYTRWLGGWVGWGGAPETRQTY